MSEQSNNREIMVDHEALEAMSKPTAASQNMDFGDMFSSLSKRFAAMNRLILRDLNGKNQSPSFYKYTKDEISDYLKDPYRYAKQLRNAVVYLYGASSHFKRLIQYFASLSDLTYVVSPHGIDSGSANAKSVRKNFYKTTSILTAMDIQNQFYDVLLTCLREDTYYGTMWVGNDSIIIQQLPSDYCDISVIEDNVLNVSFDFSYFDSNQALLDNYPREFRKKYAKYQKDRTGSKWQELDSPTSFAVKCNRDILTYPIPPFAGILREVYDIEDYKALKMTQTELQNYALLVMKLGINSDGEWEIDFDKAKKFWMNLDGVLPEQIGSILSPMNIEKIGFERTNTAEVNNVADAEQNLFSAAGVSSLIFNNPKASASALELSIKADQAITFSVVRSIEGVVNRFIRSQPFGKNFHVTFLDCSRYNRKELGDMYLKACTYGMPMVSFYCATQGLTQDKMDTMNFLEDTVLGVKAKFKPLQSSSTQSTSAEGAGRPAVDSDELSESGERWRDSQ